MATLDLLALDEATKALAASVGGSSPLVAEWVTAASLALDDLCGPIVVRAITDELHDGGSCEIFPRLCPFVTVTTLAEYDRAGASTALTAETYATKPAQGYIVVGEIIYRRASGSSARFAAGERNIRLSYTAGRYADTASVSPKFKRACAVIVSHMWGLEHGTGNSTFGQVGDGQVFTPSGFAVPRRALELLGRDVRARAAFA